MAVIDEEGRVLGVVNVVDALVVLVVLATLTTGVVLVTGGSDQSDPPTPERTAYATVAYEAPLESDAAHLAANDTLAPTPEGTNFTVVDVYRSFAPDGDAHVMARLRYAGEPTVRGAGLYGGDAVNLTTGSYRVPARVLAVNGSEATIRRATERVVLRAVVDPSVAGVVDPGDRAGLAGSDVAMVTAVERTRANGTVSLRVGAELTVWDREPVPVFDGHALRVGTPVTIVTDEVVLAGRVAAVGTDEPGDVADG